MRTRRHGVVRPVHSSLEDLFPPVDRTTYSEEEPTLRQGILDDGRRYRDAKIPVSVALRGLNPPERAIVGLIERTWNGYALLPHKWVHLVLEERGYSKKTTDRAVNQLVKYGYLKRYPTGRGAFYASAGLEIMEPELPASLKNAKWKRLTKRKPRRPYLSCLLYGLMDGRPQLLEIVFGGEGPCLGMEAIPRGFSHPLGGGVPIVFSNRRQHRSIPPKGGG